VGCTQVDWNRHGQRGGNVSGKALAAWLFLA
jgi:hypothetical protein